MIRDIKGRFLKGYHRPKKWFKNRIPWNKGLFGYKTKPASKERKIKIGLANKGRKLGFIPKGAFKKGHIPWIKGKHPECIQKENNHNWKGGGRAYYSKIANMIYKEFNINIVCEKCGNSEKIHIHHKDFNFKNNNYLNLQALCIYCHISLHRKIQEELKSNKIRR